MPSDRLLPCAFALSLVAACTPPQGTSPATSPSASSVEVEDPLTLIPEGQIRDQGETGNCWLYATAAWAESLAEKGNRSARPHYSVAYLAYWSFFEQITEADRNFKGVEWTGGSWGEASELILRYGLVEMSAFTSSGAEDAEAKLAVRAMKTINDSVRWGVLRTRKARNNHSLVRRELNRAWKVPESLVASLDETFGSGTPRTLDDGGTAKGAVLDPATIPVSGMRPREKPRPATLKDVIGERTDDDDADSRTGPLAWSSHDAPTLAREGRPALRPFLRRVQRALHDGAPIPISWCANDSGVQDSKYSRRISGVVDECAHQTLLVDYQIKLADGRVLLAKDLARTEDVAAALSDRAEIVFLRVQNSWGSDSEGAVAGHTDLYMSYLLSKVRECPDEDANSDECVEWDSLVGDVVLPPGY